MISAIVEFVRRSTVGAAPLPTSPKASKDGWREEFETVLVRSKERPRALVELARRGFPDEQRGWAWCHILRTEEVPAYLRDFERELVRIFGRADPVHFQAPCFGGPLDIARINLSEGKKETIKKLLCIVGNAHPQLEYTPIIPAIIAILSKFLEAGDALACITAMIEGHAIPASKRQEWAYFPLYRRDYLVFERVFEDLIGNFAPKVAKHISKVQLLSRDYVPEWDQILSRIFIGILPREIVVRIFDCYIVEGYKIILRFGIAHVIVRQERVLSAVDGAEIDKALVSMEPYTPELLEAYFREAMGVKFDRSIIQRYRNRRRKNSIGNFDTEDKLLIFHRRLPLLQQPSAFMRDQDWAVLWDWIPPRFRLLNLDLAFTTDRHGKHISTLLQQCRDTEPVILLLETVSRKVFGAYISKSLTPQHGPSFYGTGETFLFTLQPKACKYAWSIKSGSSAFVSVTESFIALGAGSDFGLWIDRFLTHVASAPSVTYENEAFVDGKTEGDTLLYSLEVFRFT